MQRSFILTSFFCAALALSQNAYGQQNGGENNPCVQSPQPSGDGWVYIQQPVCEWVQFDMVAPETQDGSQSGNFEIEMTPDSPNSLDNVHIAYVWSHTTPSGAARVPSGDIFNDTTSATPHVASAQWFATSGSQYREDPTSSLADPPGDPPTCTYDIQCTVTFGQTPGQQDSYDVSGTWNVWAYKNPVTRLVKDNNEDAAMYLDGVGTTNVLIISIAPDPNESSIFIASVTGTNLKRGVPTIDYDGMNTDNWFYNKIKTHEERHVAQWNGVSPYSKLYQPNEILELFANESFQSTDPNAIATWSTTLQNEASVLYDGQHSGYLGACNDYATNTSDCREQDAHGQSNGSDPGPDYLNADLNNEYQGCPSPLALVPDPTR